MGVGIVAADGQAGGVEVGGTNLTGDAVVIAVAVGAAEVDVGVLEIEAVAQIEVGGRIAEVVDSREGTVDIGDRVVVDATCTDVGDACGGTGELALNRQAVIGRVSGRDVGI